MSRPSFVRPLLTLACALIASAAFAQSAAATITPITTGSLDWGVKDTFRAYITGPIADGEITVGDGATTNPNGTFHFPLVAGGYDDESGVTTLDFGGSVNFYGHEGELNTTVENLRIELRDGFTVIKTDTESIPMGGGPSETYDDLVWANLDISTVNPVVAGGSTMWTSVPAAIAPTGIPILGTNYPTGTVMDPASFSYVGPGGKPLPAEFDPEGKAQYAQDAEVNSGNGVYRLFYDAANDVVHVLGADSVRAFDAETLAYRGSYSVPEDAPLWQFGNAFDPETGTVFASPDGGGSEVYAFEYDAAAAGYTRRTIAIPARRSLVYSTAVDKLYSFGPTGLLFTPGADVAVDTAQWNDPTWTPGPTYPVIATGGESFVDVFVTTGGKLVASQSPKVVGGNQLVRKPLLALFDLGTAFSTAPIDDTLIGSPVGWPNPGASFGYVTLAQNTTGGFGAIDSSTSAASRSRITLDSTATATGFTVAGSPQDLSFAASDLSFDANGDDVYYSAGNALQVHRDGQQFASVDVGEAISDIAAGDDRVYVVKAGETPYRLATYSLEAISPTITTQPQGESVTVDSPTTKTDVQFTAAATGSPAPTVQWYKRVPGSPDWDSIAGATSNTLSLSVGAADDGADFRAVYSNAAGDVGTTTAKLNVDVIDLTPPVLTILAPLNGSSTFDSSATLAYTVTDNADPAPLCTIAKGASVSLSLGANTITVICVDSGGNTATASVNVTRNEAALPKQTPTAPAVTTGGSKAKTLTVATKSVRAALGTIKCSSGTCKITLPKSIKAKFGKKSFKVTIEGPGTLSAGESGVVYALIPLKALKALGGKNVRLTAPATVNVDGSAFEVKLAQTYKAKQGKTGSAKK